MSTQMTNEPNSYQLSETKSSVVELRASIMTALPHLSDANHSEAWWLLGTSHCHLCEDAKALITRFQMVQPIDCLDVDISDFDEALMMQFATTIPVLLTSTRRLNYPFSVMDLQQLLSE
ncbi:glutaredoxin family protein [Psychrobacter sp. T6-1]|uniref:glutaredoxin family protein n=1 Tax=Psychrobacter sp. T6-1 TaxID=3457447 RepID=UPI003FD4D553